MCNMSSVQIALIIFTWKRMWGCGMGDATLLHTTIYYGMGDATLLAQHNILWYGGCNTVINNIVCWMLLSNQIFDFK